MGKKIHSIELKEVEIVQVEGSEEFVEIVKNQRKFPVFLTNFSLSRGRDLGILKTSLMSDLLMIKTKKDNSNGKNEEDFAADAIADIEESKMLDVIYLAFIGANPKSNMTKDEFLQQYHADYTEKLMLYFNIIAAAVSADPNAFAKGLEKSTAKNEKKPKSQS